MSCNSFEEWIALYVEGDLDPSRVRNVELHLKSCTSCQRFVKELQASQAMVKDLAAESLDPASFNVVRKRVMQEVNRRQARPVWWRFLSPAVAQWHPAWAVSLAVLVALGFLLQWQLWRKPVGSDRSDAPGVASVPAIRKESPDSSPPTPSEKAERQRPDGGQAIRQFAKRHVSPAPRDVLGATEAQPDAVATEAEPPAEQGSNLQPEEPLPADIAPEQPPPLVIKLVTDDPNIVIVWLVDQDVHHN
jgi:Putative zinc-finger